MSETGEAEDAFVSRAKPRRAAGACERGRRPTAESDRTGLHAEGARGAHRRAIAHVADSGNFHAQTDFMDAA